MARVIASPLLLLLGTWVLCATVQGMPVNNTTYWQQREALMEEDYSTMLGSTLVLSPEEELVNKLLVEVLKEEMDESFRTLNFPPAINFMLSKPDIELSQVFSIIKSMPKGAVLHIHDLALASVDYVISELTYWDYLYMCYPGTLLMFKYSESVPTSQCDDGWKVVSEERAAAASPQHFDDLLRSHITIETDDPHTAYPDINSVWSRFEKYFGTMSGIFCYRPAFEAYLSQAMHEFVEDHVTYMEFRGTLPLLYELDGRELPALETFQVYKDTIDAFQLNNSAHFYGARFIYAPPKGVSQDMIYEYVNLAVALREQFPDTVAGMDLVGQEDVAPPLKDFIDPLLEVPNSNVSIPVFYHAGETNWYGENSDENIADALLLNSSRIGHGYAITKHPALMREAIDKDTPIEVCPISNQVLLLVEDLRNHPAVGLAASSFPLVVSSDDPAAWGALPLSHDFYEAFMTLGGGRADLKFLKQLAINSITYSSLDEINKQELQTLWEGQWDTFISNTTDKLFNNTITIE